MEHTQKKRLTRVHQERERDEITKRNRNQMYVIKIMPKCEPSFKSFRVANLCVENTRKPASMIDIYENETLVHVSTMFF